eukprot:GILJ01000681.1.p1 GENE.GILJ01000681.1~~GILJ01000681.1.p1  ORF type:complete len:1333 (-),score=203.54 GILJ01000681.1:399-4319(-)
MDVMRVWLCVWFACLCIAEAQVSSLPARSEVFIFSSGELALGDAPGPVSIFTSRADCDNSKASSHHTCTSKILAHDLEYQLLQDEGDASAAKFLLGMCAGHERVNEVAGCQGNPTTPAGRLCVLLAPGNAEMSEIAADYCACEDDNRVNLAFLSDTYTITTYRPQVLACATAADFVDALPRALSRGAPPRELEAESAMAMSRAVGRAAATATGAGVDFSEFVRQVKDLPETVDLSASAVRTVVSVDTFRREFLQFMENRRIRREQSERLDAAPPRAGGRQFVIEDPSEVSFFIERITLEVAHPKLHMWGDIHGSIHSLLRTLQQIGVRDDWTLENSRDVLVFLGDYVDRGDYGPEVLYVLMKLFNMNSANVILVRGNHESIAMVETYGFDSQLKNRLGLIRTVDRHEIYTLFGTLPAAVYLRDPTSEAPQFYMFAHGGIQLSFDPSHLLAHASRSSIIRMTFTHWNPFEQLARNIIRWADIGDKPIKLHVSHSSQSVKFSVHDATVGRSSVSANVKVLNGLLSSQAFRAFETVNQPGFMWNDMTTAEYPSEDRYRTALIAVPQRGYMLPQTMVEKYMNLNSIKVIFRAHQHNGDFLRRLREDNGLFAVFAKRDHSATQHTVSGSNGWFTDVVPVGLSSAYTLNSSPNSGLGNNFDSYVILDFGRDREPLFSHRFCQLSAPGRDGVRRDVRCWHVPVRTPVRPTARTVRISDEPASPSSGDVLYGVDHGSAVSLFASLEECEIATQQKAPCVPFSSAVNIDAVTVGQMYLQMTAVGEITYTDLTYPHVTAEIVSAVCAPSASLPSQLFFPHSTSDFIRQWFVCLKPGLFSSQSFSAITARVKSADETIELKKKKKPLISYHEFKNQYKLFQDNRLSRPLQFVTDGLSPCSVPDSALHVERIQIEDTKAKIHIIGSLDGSIHSLIRILNQLGVNEDWTLKNSDDYVVFLGNYLVGSGYGMESLYVIMSLFNMNRDKVILLRGAEETNAVEFEKEIKDKFKLKKDKSKIFREISESIPVAVFVTDPATVGSDEPQFMLFTSSGIQLSWDPANFLSSRPNSRLIRSTLCDRDTDSFVRNVMKWGHIGSKKHMKIKDDSKTKSKQVWILNEAPSLRSAEAYKEELTKQMFKGEAYSKLESSTMCGFMFNEFSEPATGSSSGSAPRFVVAATKRGILISKDLLERYLHDNKIQFVFKTYTRHSGKVNPHTTQLVRTAFGTAPLFSSNRPSQHATVAVDGTANGWVSTKTKVAQSPVWVLSSASESGLGFHFDSFATLNLRTNELTQRHCSLPEPTGRSRTMRPAFTTCWPAV